ncbi:MAG: hypothetical protein ACRDKU_05905 [Gaiellaceae bacterium]
MHRASPLVREALLAAGAAASLAALLVWLGPPGNDLAAHVYQRAVFLDDGYELWNNFWYGGRYSFVTYSVLYYPLAAFFGIEPLAIASIATAALAFAVVVGRQWGPLARWSSRTFAVVWAGLIISAAFPFALGFAFGLLALWALQAGKHWRFGVLAVLTLAASPLAFLLLAILLAGVAFDLRERGRRLLAPTLIIVAIGAAQLLLTRAFPDGGRYPFPEWQLAAVATFCVLGVALTWRVESAHTLRWFFVALFAVCFLSYLVPSPVGENVARIRFVALPIAVLILSLRGWRPIPVSAFALLLAAAWNLTPHAWSFERGRAEMPAAQAAYWQPAIEFLNENLTPSYRVEVVDTAGHWAAVHLPQAGIPLVRGWFRQDDFPQNEVLYEGLNRESYRRWLHGLGVQYVVLTDASTDYSAKHEERLVRSGQSGLEPVYSSERLTIFAVPGARPIVTGPAPAEVVDVGQGHMLVRLEQPGRYRVAVRHSPYWRADAGCVSRGRDDMLRLHARRAGLVRLEFRVKARQALAAVVGAAGAACPRP